MKRGRGVFAFPDGSTMACGHDAGGALHGTCVNVDEHGQTAICTMVHGGMCGPAEERDAGGRLTAKGAYADDARCGHWAFYFADGGWMEGPVDPATGQLAGDGVTYHYPQSGNILHGAWDAHGSCGGGRRRRQTMP